MHRTIQHHTGSHTKADISFDTMTIIAEPTTAEEVKQTIKLLKNGKAARID